MVLIDYAFQLLDYALGWGLVIFLIGALIGAFKPGSGHDPGTAGTL
jgi:hypothetical protein